MACFLVPATEAIVATVIRKAMEAKGVKLEKVKLNRDGRIETVEKLPFTHKLKWLTNLLWGGSALLAFEHVWHGEVVPWFPFLTAAADPADAAEMLHEMSTVGVTMAVLITVVWLGMVAVSGALENRALKPQAAKN
ncbi:MAG: hypothetical protein IKE76_03805 [Clostridia bacterium]|nr:hypothetical protein [Clostridia bacterium]